MRVFTRTTSGLSNLRFFHQADFTVYIEGKTEPIQAGQETPDARYYMALMKAVRPKKIAKIKVVGNKIAALEYAKKLRNEKIKDSVVIVDKDLEGVTSSILPVVPLIRTFGYSWENEIWSMTTVLTIINDLTGSSSHPSGNPLFLSLIAKRLRYISALDAGVQVGGQSLLPKNKALCGVNFKFPLVTAKEIRRISRIYKNNSAATCPVSSLVILSAITHEPCQVIQGHFWSNAVQGYIRDFYKRFTKDAAPSNNVMLNLALSFMKRDSVAAVGETLISRYDKELSRFEIYPETFFLHYYC